MNPPTVELLPQRIARRAVWFHTAQFVMIFAALTFGLHLTVTSQLMPSFALSVGLAILVTQFALVSVIMSLVLYVKSRRLLHQRRVDRASPQMRTDLAAYAAGREGDDKLRGWHHRMPDELELRLVEFLPALNGRQRGRLTRFIGSIGLIERWRQQYAEGNHARRLEAMTRLSLVAGPPARVALIDGLDEPYHDLSVQAAKGLLSIGEEDDAEKVLEFALRQNPLVRAVLADDLKPHADVLARILLPRLGLSGETELLIRGLEMLGSWKVYVSFPAVGTLLCHELPEVAALALRILPFVVERDRFGSEVQRALIARNASVRAAAAFCAGRLRLRSAAELLAERLEDRDAHVARAAADALSALGEDGQEVLDGAIVSSGRRGAQVAVEALERVRTRRLRATGA